jgi:hypothetical protein
LMGEAINEAKSKLDRLLATVWNKGLTMYKVANKTFSNVNEAIEYANWIHKVSRIIVAVERI